MTIRQGATISPARLRRSQSEAAFQRSVCALLDLHGWTWHHEVDSRRSKRGLPDLIALRGDRLLFAELKSDHGRVRPEQQAWLDRLRLVTGVEVHLWRPRDLDAIEEVLR